MAEPLTEELLNELLFSSSLSEFLNDKLTDPETTLPEYLRLLLKNKGVKKADIIRASRLNTTFAYQVFSGDRRASKDKLLQLCFAFRLDLRETQRLLKIANAGELYCKNRRDAIIIHCISKNLSLEETDDTLFQYQEKTICEE